MTHFLLFWFDFLSKMRVQPVDYAPFDGLRLTAGVLPDDRWAWLCGRQPSRAPAF
jgi:hypothetical protein